MPCSNFLAGSSHVYVIRWLLLPVLLFFFYHLKLIFKKDATGLPPSAPNPCLFSKQGFWSQKFWQIFLRKRCSFDKLACTNAETAALLQALPEVGKANQCLAVLAPAAASPSCQGVELQNMKMTDWQKLKRCWYKGERLRRKDLCLAKRKVRLLLSLANSKYACVSNSEHWNWLFCCEILHLVFLWPWLWVQEVDPKAGPKLVTCFVRNW